MDATIVGSFRAHVSGDFTVLNTSGKALVPGDRVRPRLPSWDEISRGLPTRATWEVVPAGSPLAEENMVVVTGGEPYEVVTLRAEVLGG